MKPQVHNVRKFGLGRGHSKGFTLLELIVASAIIAMTTVWSIPEFRRAIAQSQVDRYTRNVESGLFSFRAKMGAFKESCTIDFGNIPSFQTSQYRDASEILEQQTFKAINDNDEQLIRSQSDPLYRCNYTSGDLNDLINDSSEVNSQNEALRRIQEVAASVRLVDRLNSRASKVNVASTAQTYLYTSRNQHQCQFDDLLIQAKEANQAWAQNQMGQAGLSPAASKPRDGQVFSGTWTGNRCQSN